MDTWISLQKLLDSLESDTEFNQLDTMAQRMLEWIAVRTKSPAPLHIQEVVIKSEIASPATVHKIIGALEQQGLISVSKDKSDSRRRIVCLTAKAERLLAKLSRDVESWAKTLAKPSASRTSTR